MMQYFLSHSCSYITTTYTMNVPEHHRSKSTAHPYIIKPAHSK